MAIYANENGTIKTLADGGSNIIGFPFSQSFTFIPEQASERYKSAVIGTFDYAAIKPKFIIFNPYFYEWASQSSNDYNCVNPLKIIQGSAGSLKVTHPGSSLTGGGDYAMAIEHATIAVNSYGHNGDLYFQHQCLISLVVEHTQLLILE